MSASRNAARPNVRAIIDGMNLKAALLAPQYTGLASVLQEFAEADRTLEEAAWEYRKNELTKAYGFGSADSSKPFAFAGGIAIIPIHGVLINRFSYSWGFVTGYNFIRSQLDAALGDDDVTLIAYDVNTYGGMVAGCFETGDDIFASRDLKPSISLVDSNCYSAGYALGSAASRMVVTPSSGVGSIGVVAMHVNFADYLKQVGIEITFIYAGDHKVDGNPYEALSPDVKKSIQASIDKNYATFVNTVARNRNLSADVVKGTQAQTYDADDALALGLIDAIQPPATAIEAYLDELSGSENDDDQTEQDMSTKPNTGPDAQAKTAEQLVAEAASANATATAQAVADARKGERERMAAITGCEEAKGKSKLASHIAMNTEMSVEDAKAMLAAAAPEVTSAQAASTEQNHFRAAMDAGQHPNVGADGSEAAGPEGEKTGAARILAAQRLATGRKPKAA